MKKVHKIEEFPTEDHVAVLIREGDSAYGCKFSYNHFDNLTEFNEWIKKNPSVAFVPIVAKKIEFNIEVIITNLEQNSTQKIQDKAEVLEDEDDFYTK